MNDKRRPLALVGPGAAGGAVAVALADAGWPVVGVSGRTASSTAAAAARLGLADLGPSSAPSSEWDQARLVLLAVRDDDVASVAAQLVDVTDWTDRVVLHLSGALSGDVLAPLARAGAAVGSLHPLMTFPRDRSPVLPADTPFVVEGDAGARQAARELVHALDRPLTEIPADAKVLYHCAATVAGNLTTALLEAGRLLLREAGVEGGERLLAPLARESVLAGAALGPRDALTGPVARGDEETLGLHLQALAAAKLPPTVRRAHASLSLLACDLARERGVAAPTCDRMRRALEGVLDDLRSHPGDGGTP